MVDFGKRLKELRKEKGLTQQQLAERIWVTKATISYYEQSERIPSPDVLIKLSRVFHVSTDHLLGLDSRKNSTFDTDGLTDADVEFVESTIEYLRRKNNKNL